MPHNDFAFRNVYGQPSAVVVPSPAVLRALDLAASQCIDGDNGGTWNPVAPIILGGAGLQIASQGFLSSVSTGPQAAPRAVILPNDSSIQFGTSRSISYVFPVRDFLTRADEMSSAFATSGGSTQQAYDEGSPNALKTIQTFNGATTRIIARLPWFRVPRAGSLTASLRFRVGTSTLITSAAGGAGVANPAGLTGLPGFRLARMLQNGTILTTGDLLIPAWVNGRIYNVGDLVIPTTANGRQFRCTVAGTSGASQPATFTSAAIGATVTDNTVTWTCEIGPATATSPHYFTLPLPQRPDIYYAQGQFQDISIPANITASQSFLQADYLSTFLLDILDKSDSANTFHSLKITVTMNAPAPQI